MEIKVLGPGCQKCKTLEKAVKKIVDEEGLDAVVTKVDDMVEIMKAGIMTTPALIIDEKIVLKGKVPSQSELKKILTK